MGGPCWRGEVDGLILGAGVEFREKEPAEVDGTGAGYGLEGDDPFLSDGGRGGASGDALGCECEVREAGDGKVFVVEVGVGAKDGIGLR